MHWIRRATIYFYPRPPRGGRHAGAAGYRGACPISIHALREEGDKAARQAIVDNAIFLSTPSARRATPGIQMHIIPAHDFYPRPPRGGRRLFAL